MLAPLLLLWPMSVALTWLVAQSHRQRRPYDRELADVAQALARQSRGGRPRASTRTVARRRDTASRPWSAFNRGGEEGDEDDDRELPSRCWAPVANWWPARPRI